MDIVLIAVTVVSLAVALGASVIAWRLSQEEKRRTAARISALRAAAGVPLQAGPEAAAPAVAAAPWRTPASVEAARAPVAAEPARAPRPVRVEPVQADSAAMPLHHGFLGAETHAPDDANPQRWLTAAAVVVAVLLGGFALLRMTDGPPPSTAAHAEATPLELLSLRHEREGTNLAVAGLVRNPPAGAAVERVSAVVLLFDQQGAFVTSATAPIEFRRLTGGEESPFVVKVAAPQAVARYRVSFRSEGGTLPHVDRRAEQAASPVALTGGGKGHGTDDQD